MEGHLRLSFCGTIKDIMDGVERIKWALDPSRTERALPRRPQAGEGLAMNIYLDVQSPAVKQAGALASLYGLENHGLTQPPPRLLEPARSGALRGGDLPLRRADVRTRVRSWSTPASTPPAPPRTSSSCASSRPKRTSGGASTTGPSIRRASASCTPGSRATCRAATCSCRTSTPEPIPSTACRSAIITQKAWHSLFARTMFIKNTTIDQARRHVPDFTVIAAPGLPGRPDGGRDAQRDLHRPQLPAEAGHHRRHRLRAARSRRRSSPSSTTCCRLEGVLSMHCSANVGQ